MALYRGPGGAGDATNDATNQSILAAASAAQAAASAAAASASASQAATSATNSASSATASANSATAAASSANSASTSATNAANSATNAANSATTAQTAQTAAELAETNAETAEANAETAEANATASAALAQEWATKTSGPVAGGEYSSKYNAQLAATSATNAANSATSASTSASAASTSATNAASSATAAASSASAASTSATNAANSATAAATSATSAASSASTATTQATNAASSATAAATSASNAATSETNAAASATSASSSATSASSSATSASNSASSAATSATNAAASAIDAQSSEDAAAAYAASINPANFLTKANNLSDLTNTSTARTNLGVAIGTNVQAYSSELQAISNGGGNAMFKNRIINGACMIDQRNAGASVTITAGGSSIYTVDRWAGINNTDGGFTIARSTVAPAGFTNSLLATVTSTDSSIGASQSINIRQNIEGFNVADLGWGTANAQPITIGFWARSSVTGQYGIAVNNSAYSRSYVSNFTINSANTYEYKTITIPGDTSGTWLTDNSIGLVLQISLSVGSDRLGTANTWASNFFYGTSGQVNWIGNSGATFYITGVQLEKGSTATSFDYRPYGTELALCQRYYQVIGGGGASAFGALANWDGISAYGGVVFPVTMRASPSYVLKGAAADALAFFGNGSSTKVLTALDVHALVPTGGELTINWSGVLAVTSYPVCWFRFGVPNSLTFSAEL